MLKPKKVSMHEVWILILEELHRVHQEESSVEVKKKEVTLFETVVTEGR